MESEIQIQLSISLFSSCDFLCVALEQNRLGVLGDTDLGEVADSEAVPPSIATSTMTRRNLV